MASSVAAGLKLGKSGAPGLLVPLALVGILAILIFPLPTALLDVCIALNITVSLIILFTSLYIDRPLMFVHRFPRSSWLPPCSDWP